MTAEAQVLALIGPYPGLTVGELLTKVRGKSGHRDQLNRICLRFEREGKFERLKGQREYQYYLAGTAPAGPPTPARQDQRWTPEEMLSAVVAYWHMLQLELAGQPYIKKQVVSELLDTTLAERTRASIEFRMQNISAVLASTGRPYIAGYKPAEHVGARPRQQILKFLAELDGTLPDVLRDLPSPSQRPPEGRVTPERQERTAYVFQRDSAVVAWVLARASGRCESCHNPAPFQLPDGTPYLEVHHVKPLAEGGEDTPQNTVAICPNCHREVHYGVQAATLRQSLQQYLQSLTL